MHHRWLAGRERLRAGAGCEDLLVVLQDLGALVRGAGPPQPPIQVDQHDPGGIGVEQLLGRHHSLVQGGGQVLLGLQVGQGGDTLGEHRRVDRHGVPLGPVAELANPVNRPGNVDGPGVPIRPYSPTKSCGLSADSSQQAEQESALSPYAPPATAHSDAPPGQGMA
jgi:hypothetical protein